MKLIKNFKDFSILESGNTEMAYRTFFLVPIGTSENYCYMDFELTPISTSMPDMEESKPGECWIDHFDDDCDHYEKGTAEWEDCKDAENNTGNWITEGSVGYGKIFIVTFFLPLDAEIEIFERSVDDKETIEDVITELINQKKEIVSLYHLENPNKDDGGYDHEDEYDFDLIGSMIESSKVSLRDVIISLLGCSSSIKNDFIERFTEIHFTIDVTHEDMRIIRKYSPEIFQTIRNKISTAADTSADLGELGF
jgi:hypothetical protein